MAVGQDLGFVSPNQDLPDEIGLVGKYMSIACTASTQAAVLVANPCLRQGPLEAGLVISGRRALMFLFESS